MLVCIAGLFILERCGSENIDETLFSFHIAAVLLCVNRESASTFYRNKIWQSLFCFIHLLFRMFYASNYGRLKERKGS